MLNPANPFIDFTRNISGLTNHRASINQSSGSIHYALFKMMIKTGTVKLRLWHQCMRVHTAQLPQQRQKMELRVSFLP